MENINVGVVYKFRNWRMEEFTKEVTKVTSNFVYFIKTSGNIKKSGRETINDFKTIYSNIGIK